MVIWCRFELIAMHTHKCIRNSVNVRLEVFNFQSYRAMLNLPTAKIPCTRTGVALCSDTMRVSRNEQQKWRKRERKERWRFLKEMSIEWRRDSAVCCESEHISVGRQAARCVYVCGWQTNAAHCAEYTLLLYSFWVCIVHRHFVLCSMFVFSVSVRSSHVCCVLECKTRFFVYWEVERPNKWSWYALYDSTSSTILAGKRQQHGDGIAFALETPNNTSGTIKLYGNLTEGETFWCFVDFSFSLISLIRGYFLCVDCFDCYVQNDRFRKIRE